MSFNEALIEPLNTSSERLYNNISEIKCKTPLLTSEYDIYNNNNYYERAKNL